MDTITGTLDTGTDLPFRANARKDKPGHWFNVRRSDAKPSRFGVPVDIGSLPTSITVNGAKVTLTAGVDAKGRQQVKCSNAKVGTVDFGDAKADGALTVTLTALGDGLTNVTARITRQGGGGGGPRKAVVLD